MRLTMNGTLVTDPITASEMQTFLKNLPPAEVVTLLLADEESSLAAVGSPQDGYRLTYTDLGSGETMTSANAGLRPVTLKHITQDYIAGRIAWRHRVGWNENQIRLTPSQQRQRWRYTAPVLIYLLIFALGFAPLVLLTRLAADKLYFEPQCATINPEVAVAAYSRGATMGSGGVLNVELGRGVGNCIYADYSLIPFSEVLGDESSAIAVDRFADLLMVSIPLGIMVGLLFGMMAWYGRDGGRKKQPT